MPILSTNTVCSSTAARLCVGAGGGADPKPVTIYNKGPGSIFIGGSSAVTKDSGVILAQGATANFSLVDGDDLWAITNTSTPTVTVFQGRS